MRNGAFCSSLSRLASFAGRRRFARALQPHQQNHRRRHRRVRQRCLLLTQHAHQLVVHDLHELLAGTDRLEDLLPDRFVLNPLQELPGQIEADIGLEQDPANFPKPLANRVFAEHAAPGKARQRGTELGRELIEHKP